LIRNGIMITKNSSQFVIPTINRVAEYTHTHTDRPLQKMAHHFITGTT